MVEFRSVLFVLSFFFFFFPGSFSASHSFFCLLSFFFFFFFLPLSWCIAFLNSLSKFLHLSVHIMGDRFLSSPMKSAPTSACSTSAWTHISARLDFDFNFDFMVLVPATVIAKNHLLVLVVRVGVSVRLRW